jgi:anti-sigma regulatory factor (Ser/Thr protein kinase)
VVVAAWHVGAPESASLVPVVLGAVVWSSRAQRAELRRSMLQLDSALANARRVAGSLQEALLPRTLPSVPGISFAATHRTDTDAKIGGDWYDVFTLPDGMLALTIGDVVWHGLEAAAMMIRMREMLRAAAMLEGAFPDRILAAANRTLAAFDEGIFVTAAVAVVDPRSLRFAYSCAGHPRPRLLRGDDVTALTRGGLPLGVDAHAEYDVDVFELRAGDRLVFFTDGLVEAAHDMLSGERRLMSALAGGVVEPETLIDYVAGPQLRDDVAVLTMRVADRYPIYPDAEPAWRFFSNDASTAAPARASLTAYLRKRRLSESAIVAAEVVFGELVGNVVRHAPGPIEVELFWSEEIPALVVRDRGAGFEPNLELPDVLSETGRGLFLIGQHGGSLFVMPRHGGGSDVMVLMPILVEAPSSAP